MTEWTTRHERHVPEEELHAYFDQALSRSQCAEIETHLSHCARCQAQRAEVAALRDRTTAVLAQLSPRPVIVPPPFQVLLDRRSRELRFAMWRVRFTRAAKWAAGIAAATGLGWLARTVLDPHGAPLPSVPIAEVSGQPANPAPQVVAVVPQETTAVDRARPAPIAEPEPPVTLDAAGRRASGPSATPAAQQVTPVNPELDVVSRPAPPEPASDPGFVTGDPFSRIWRLIQWEEAIRTAEGGLPFIEGLTVVGVLLRPGAPGERPTVIVTQQDARGEVIQSIEGPVEVVEDVLQRQRPDIHVSERARTTPDYVPEPDGSVRRNLRILAITGKLPVDSLNALVRVATIR
ncbi:MAG: anti-sigma factor family protein [Gemmatimonadales bacterium]